MDIKDYLLFKCSNLAITSPDVAQFTWLCDYRKQNWSHRLLAKYDFAITKLPKIKPSMSLVQSGLCRDAAEALGLREFTPLAVGSSDVVANAVGTSVSHGFGPHIYLGTSSWLAAHVNKSTVLPRFNIATINSPTLAQRVRPKASNARVANIRWNPNNKVPSQPKEASHTLAKLR